MRAHAGSAHDKLDGTGSNGDADNDFNRIVGTVMISSDQPARDMRKVVESLVEQLTTILNFYVSLKLAIYAKVSTGLDRVKVRTVLENAKTLEFIDKKFN